MFFFSFAKKTEWGWFCVLRVYFLPVLLCDLDDDLLVSSINIHLMSISLVLHRVNNFDGGVQCLKHDHGWWRFIVSMIMERFRDSHGLSCRTQMPMVEYWFFFVVSFFCLASIWSWLSGFIWIPNLNNLCFAFYFLGFALVLFLKPFRSRSSVPAMPCCEFASWVVLPRIFVNAICIYRIRGSCCYMLFALGDISFLHFL